MTNSRLNALRRLGGGLPFTVPVAFRTSTEFPHLRACPKQSCAKSLSNLFNYVLKSKKAPEFQSRNSGSYIALFGNMRPAASQNTFALVSIASLSLPVKYMPHQISSSCFVDFYNGGSIYAEYDLFFGFVQSIAPRFPRYYRRESETRQAFMADTACLRCRSCILLSE